MGQLMAGIGLGLYVAALVLITQILVDLLPKKKRFKFRFFTVAVSASVGIVLMAMGTT